MRADELVEAAEIIRSQLPHENRIWINMYNMLKRRKHGGQHYPTCPIATTARPPLPWMTNEEQGLDSPLESHPHLEQVCFISIFFFGST